jgi:hypothetical protein
LKVFKTDFKIFLLLSFKGISKFQNSEYDVHQVVSNEACSLNFSYLALNLAELAAPQILSKNLRQQPGIIWIFCSSFLPFLSLNPGLLGLKVNNGDQCTKRPSDLSEKIHNLVDLSFIGQCLKYSEGKYEVSY